MENRINASIVNKKKNYFINDLLSAIIICFGLINGAIGYEGISYVTISFVFVLCIIGFITKEFKVDKFIIFVILYVLLFFLFSFLILGNNYYTMYYFKYFLGFCVISMLIGSQKISIRKVIKYVEILGLFCVFIIVIRGINNYDASIQMGIAYSFLPVLYASVIMLFRKHFMSPISLVNVIGILWCYFFMAPRGIWLNIIITSLIYFFVMYGKNKSIENIIKARIKIAVFFIICAVIIFINFENILLGLSNLVSGITSNKIYAIDKMVFLFNSGNLTNGRSDLIVLAQKLSNNNFFFGRGIGYFESIQGSGGYVHNIFYQTIVESGVFFLIPLILILLVTIINLLHINKKRGRLDMAFFILIISNGLITLFYSSVHWKLLLFWFLIGYLYRISKKKVIIRRENEIYNKGNILFSSENI